MPEVFSERAQSGVLSSSDPAQPVRGGGPGPLFHGGYPDLQPGELLVPPPSPRRPTDFAGRVYLTPHVEVALMFAARQSLLWPHGGAVYEVEPVGELEQDPWGGVDYLLCVLAGEAAGGVIPAEPCAGRRTSRHERGCCAGWSTGRG